MKIELTRDELERIIMEYIKNEIAPYVTFGRNVGNDWGLPETLAIYSKEQNATQ
jgi:hypothetical protein